MNFPAGPNLRGPPKAHFHPEAEREIYIDLPPEDAEDGMVGLLKRTIYGTRDAAHSWDKFYNKVSDGTSWKAGLACPCIYCKPGTFTIGWRHGDDIIIVGEETDINADYEYLSKHVI